MVRTLFIVTAIAGVLSAAAAGEHRPTRAEVRGAVERCLPYLVDGGESWIQLRSTTNPIGCVSCHRVAFMIWSHNEGRRRGLKVDAKQIEEWTEWSLEKMLARGKEGGGLDTMSQMILARDTTVRWPDKPAAERKGVDHLQTIWEYIVDRQKPDGSWTPEGQLHSPSEVTTRWAIVALASRDGGEASSVSRSKAVEYLKRLEPSASTEALLLRLLVERRFGEPARATELRKELRERQLADGGWAYQKSATESDAFATGQVLYALSQEGIDDTDAAIQGGRHFLIKTQRDDGSWLVPTRAIHSVEGISAKRLAKTDPINTYWGSAWATIGLVHTLPPQPSHEQPREK
jgi:hypothetical protein